MLHCRARSPKCGGSGHYHDHEAPAEPYFLGLSLVGAGRAECVSRGDIGDTYKLLFDADQSPSAECQVETLLTIILCKTKKECLLNKRSVGCVCISRTLGCIL